MTTRIRTILKYGLALFLLSLYFAPATFAQGRSFDPERMQERMEAQIEDTIQHLGLTEEKADLVRPILQASMEKRMALMKNRQDRQAMRAKMQEIDKETETELANVLSDEEMTTYKKLQEERRSQRPGHRGPRQGNSF
jgi:C4-dicarboxylate-specific signal transduction histidine kinase